VEEVLDAYRAIRHVPLDPDRAVPVERVLIRREIAEFELTAGTFFPFRPELGRVTGGLFLGEGVLRARPDDPVEREHIRTLNDGKDLEAPFESLFLLFTDGTDGAIAAAAGAAAAEPSEREAEKRLERFRKELRERFRWNVSARITADLVSERPAGYFFALLEGGDGRRFGLEIDPLDREAVALFRYEKKRYGKGMAVESWCSTRASGGGPTGPEDPPPGRADAASYDMVIRIDGDQVLDGTADIVFTPLVEGARMLPVNLAPTLRVEAVTLDEGADCGIIQEDEEEDADLWVVFPEPLAQGVPSRMSVSWSGKDVVKKAGGGNFSVSRRTSWYPNFGLLTDRADYRMKFAVPKGRTLIATGRLDREWTAGGLAYSRWESVVPFSVVGFNYGKFEKKTEKDDRTGIEVESYSNRGLKDELLVLRMRLEQDPDLRAAVMIHPQELTTKKMTKDAAVQGLNACNVFTHYFGEIPFRKIAISQQPSGSFGQAWPTLIYLPYTAMLKPDVRDRLGLRSDEFYETVAAHEVAHQWFGHLVGGETYHDQWMEEGFAEYAAALYLFWTEGEEGLLRFMRNRRDLIVGDVGGGLRLTDVGPIWLGRRLDTIENPGNHRLIYDKGAFVLHMLRMMLYDHRAGSDDRFIAMMHDYTSRHSNRNVTTADFRAVVEQHFRTDMGWFFDQWVYGTAVPSYTWSHVVTPTPDDNYLLTIELTQRDVPDDFRVLFPFRIDFPNGFNVVTLDITGGRTIRRRFKLPALPERIEANPGAAVLFDEIEAVAPPGV
jgi:hypothetical protein